MATQRNYRPSIKWTEAEENILLECIGENPTNLKACFLAASRRLPVRSARACRRGGGRGGACSSHWYTVMAGKEDVVEKLTIGRSTVVRNKTRLDEKTEITHKKSIVSAVWNAILNALFRQ